ncbi:MAG: recombinase family protein [Planctomycetes bacterium]|nr:recombinase family protein [Planctomycetota bacterium]
MTDVAAAKVDVVAIYKLDRLSRSLVDFAKIVDLLQKRGIALVSVTQQFSTATSLGKLTLGILMSFAQFEREVISERTKDKVLATRRRGAWTGGRPVLGYDVRDKALVINKTEADLVREIFRLYLDHGGLVATVAELERRGIKNKSWVNKAGKPVHGTPFDKNGLRALLTNPLYTGKVRCGSELVAGRHDAIVDVALFDEVQDALRNHRRGAPRNTTNRWGAILSGILRCGRCGAAMSHAANTRGNRIHRYYICQTVMKEGADACPGSRAPAAQIEEVVTAKIRGIGADPTVLLATLNAARQARLAQQPELIAESRRITNDRTELTGQRKNLLDALQHGGVAANTIAGRLAEVDEQISRLQARHDEIATALAAMQNDSIDEVALRTALAEFAPIWDQLLPKERARILRLLIAEVRFTGATGELTIEFRDNAIEALARDTANRRSA